MWSSVIVQLSKNGRKLFVAVMLLEQCDGPRRLRGDDDNDEDDSDAAAMRSTTIAATVSPTKQL